MGHKSLADRSRALQVRTLVQRELTAALGEWDLLLSPAAPTTAYRVGQARPRSLAQTLTHVLLSPARAHHHVPHRPAAPWSIGPNPYS